MTEKKQIRKVRTEEKDLIHPENVGFKERITPKKISDEDGVYLFKCKCDGAHFRHAGYIQVMVPFMRPGNEKRVSVEEKQVWVCTECKKCYVWLNEQMYDVSDDIDLEAWEETEKELHKATGPGGQC